MSKPRKPIKPRGKQHDARAASFKRIAKAIRMSAGSLPDSASVSKRDLAIIEVAIKDEANLLRSMR